MTTTTRTIARTHRRTATATTRTPISIPREHCFFCAGFPIVVTSHGIEICPVCYGAGVQ